MSSLPTKNRYLSETGFTRTHTRYVCGFTLVEILVVVSIGTAIGLGALSFLRDSTVFTSIFQQQLTTVDEGRKILRPLVGEVRSATAAHTGAYPLEIVQEETFVFYSDINSDDIIERVRYFIDDNTLKKGVIVPSGSPLVYEEADEVISWVMTGVRNSDHSQPVFEYFDTYYTGVEGSLVQPVVSSHVRLVKMTLVIDHDPGRYPDPVTLTTQMTMRNIKDNL
jgi:prepilin-type N-terminal cleavage/methylation domain-containing protein